MKYLFSKIKRSSFFPSIIFNNLSLFRRAGYVTCFFLSFSLYSSDTIDSRSGSIPLIIDTDCSVDDMVAIAYLVNHPKIDILALTTTGNGISHSKIGAQNILNLLELIGQPNILVAKEEQKSLSPAGQYPPKWRKEADDVMGIKLPKNSMGPTQKSSSKLILDTLMAVKEKVTILSTGPLTNIALALKEEASIKNKIERIIFRGGSNTAPGNISGKPQGFRNLVAEYNVFLDAKAMQTILEFGIPITVIPLDLRESVGVTRKLYEKVESMRLTPSAHFLYEVLNPFAELVYKGSQKYLWSALAAVILTHPEIGQVKEFKAAVNLRKGPEYGRLIVGKQGNPIQMATYVNSESFYHYFLEGLNHSIHFKAPPACLN